MMQYFKFTTNEGISSCLKILISIVTSQIFFVTHLLNTYLMMNSATMNRYVNLNMWCKIATQSRVINIWPRVILQQNFFYKAFMYKHVWIINIFVIPRM